MSYEGERPFPTTGRDGFLHPSQEAVAAERRLRAAAAPDFDEFLVLRFKATNTPPYPFEWANYHEIRLDYGAALSRISARYRSGSNPERAAYPFRYADVSSLSHGTQCSRQGTN